MSKRNHHRHRPSLFTILLALLIALLLYGFVSFYNANHRLHTELLGVKREINDGKRKQIELQAKLNAVQAAVVETNVKIALAKSVGKLAPKPTKTLEKPEVTYVDPVTTAIVGGVLTVGKAVITKGEMILR